MEYTITVKTEEKFDLEAIVDAVKNKLLVDCIYDEVFRPIIKYSDDEEKVKAFEMVWEKVSDYLESKE